MFIGIPSKNSAVLPTVKKCLLKELCQYYSKGIVNIHLLARALGLFPGLFVCLLIFLNFYQQLFTYCSIPLTIPFSWFDHSFLFSLFPCVLCVVQEALVILRSSLWFHKLLPAGSGYFLVSSLGIALKCNINLL